MNKEQFKNSILNLINYYVNEAIVLNVNAYVAEQEGRKGDIDLVLENQAGVLTQAFEAKLSQIVDAFVPEQQEEGEEADE